MVRKMYTTFVVVIVVIVVVIVIVIVVVVVVVVIVVVVFVIVIVVVVVVIVIVIAVVVAKHQKRFLASNTKYKMNETGNFSRKSIVKLNQCHYIEKMLLHYENVVTLRKKLLYNMKMLLH